MRLQISQFCFLFAKKVMFEGLSCPGKMPGNEQRRCGLMRCLFTFVQMRRYCILVAFISAVCAKAQVGGSGVYNVLKQPLTARMAAWGGYCNAWRDKDVNLFMVNPALLNGQMHNRLSMNFNSQLKGVWAGNAAYARKWKRDVHAGLGIAFLNFGMMDAYDAGGNPEGQVQANETAITGGLSKQINSRWSLGANLKFVYSILGQYISTGAAVDVGSNWTSEDSLVSASLVLRNMGFQLLTYVKGMREPLPFTAEAGINFKPRHMPFRFNIVAHQLQRFDLTYNQFLKSNSIDLSGEQTFSPEATFGEKVFRHLTFGTELVLGKNFGIMGGYSHQRRREMAPDIRPGVAGFSWGIHFKVSKIQIAYSSMAYFPGFNANLFTFTSQISDFRRKTPISRS
jgi:hypothetical protein